MAKKVKMIFKEDKYITVVDKKSKRSSRVSFAQKGKAVEVEEASVARWMKRGGVIVGSEEERADKEKEKSDAKKIADEAAAKAEKEAKAKSDEEAAKEEESKGLKDAMGLKE